MAPMATTRHWPGVQIEYASKKRRKKWRASSNAAECVSSSHSRTGRQEFRIIVSASAVHGGENAGHHAARIFLLGELRKDAFEGWLLHEIAQALDGVIGHDFPVAQDQDRRADLLHNFEHVRAVENHFPLGGQRLEQ